ncbi:MAG: transcription elongation factor GreA [Oscillospiraceae bacterium]
MAIKPVLLTSEGLLNLENEVEQLKTIRRKEVAEKIKIALSFGDLSENSEYDEAKNEQAMVESRIAEIEAMLKNVSMVNEDVLSIDNVSIGSTVTVCNKKINREDTYKIVGSTEAAPLKKRISDESPVGKALLGHKLGEIVDVETPSGIIKFEIVKISR